MPKRMLYPHFSVCCLLLLGGLWPQNALAGQVTNATGVFTLNGLSLPDLAPPGQVHMHLPPGQSETVSLPPGNSRLKADMGMVRFVFPAGEYGTAQTLVVEGCEHPLLVVRDARGNQHRVPGIMLNLRAADAGDEAVFDARQFLPPADAGDVGTVLGLDSKQLADGWEGAMAYGPLRGTGHLRVQQVRVQLTLSGKLTSETVTTVLDAVAGPGRLWRVAFQGAAGTARSGGQDPKARRQLASDVTAALRNGKGGALLTRMVNAPVSGATIAAPFPSDTALCALVEMDFAKAQWRLFFVTAAQARVRMQITGNIF